jgi:hypothetical protein
MLFDIFATGRPVLVSWPLSSSAYWLALDRNSNGQIDNGGELFGNATLLRSGRKAPHGYIALAEFDDNQDGRIDENDEVFSRLVLWRSPLPQGGSDPADEIRRLSTAGVTAISLRVQEIGRKDRWGNLFKYRAKVEVGGRSRWSYDVFLQVVVPPSGVRSSSVMKWR